MFCSVPHVCALSSALLLAVPALTRCSCAEPVSCHESSSLSLSLSLPIHRCTGERSWLSPVVGPSLHCWVSDRVRGAEPCQCLLVTILYIHCLNAPLYIHTYIRTYVCAYCVSCTNCIQYLSLLISPPHPTSLRTATTSSPFLRNDTPSSDISRLEGGVHMTIT